MTEPASEEVRQAALAEFRKTYGLDMGDEERANKIRTKGNLDCTDPNCHAHKKLHQLNTALDQTQREAWTNRFQAQKLQILLQRVLDDKRIRHDHAYPMELGPHHCPGCDLQTDIQTTLGNQP